LKFAHFAHVWGKTGMTPEQRYDQLWRELELADAVGFDYGFCVEHHFNPDESWMSAPNIYATAVAARTRHLRIGAMGHIVPLHHPVRLAEEIALTDQVVGGRLEVGLVPGIVPHYFGPFQADYETRRDMTLEFVGFLRTAYTDAETFSFEGRFHAFTDVKLAVNPKQRPHPPLWLETRDAATLAFCASEGINTGYFLLFPRATAKARYGTYLERWRAAGWPRKPNIGYSTVVYVDETDEKAIATALDDAGRAYRGFFLPAKTEEELLAMQAKGAEVHEKRGDPGAAAIFRHLLDKDYLLENELILIGSPDTVATKLRSWAEEGMFNTFMGEFNFGELAEEDVMRSIRLFGTEVIPQLRDFEPF
jgi:alkanesulfonate monooxygenase SsuD/methylene tetrahydromethanopterin reductase-like flavin-dependent oxidoreductase (luciferase family)